MARSVPSRGSDGGAEGLGSGEAATRVLHGHRWLAAVGVGACRCTIARGSGSEA